MTNRQHPRTQQQSVRGFSLIELMVSLTIGLIIAVAAVSAYLGAASAGKMAEAQSRMNEDAQAALAILTQQLRMAGNNPKRANRVDASTPTLASLRNPVYMPTPTYAGFSVSPSTYTLSNFKFIRGCTGRFGNITSTTATIDTLDTSTCAAGTSTLPDSLAVIYEADRFNTIPTTAGAPTDCLGNALTTITANNVPTIVGGTVTTATPVTFTVAENRFFIGTSTAIVSPSLYCKGNGGASTAQPLVENIEDMRLTYGTLSTSATVTGVVGYLRADQILSEPSLAALTSDASRWKKVIAVRICVVVRSEAPVVDSAASAKYLDCEGNLVSAPDLRLRRAYSTTVELRN